jgi:hypothetical protein
LTGVKFLPAFLLAASLALPWYTFLGGAFVGPDGVISAGKPAGADSVLWHRSRIGYYAAWSFNPLAPQSWLIPLAFLWPLPLLALYFPGRDTRLSRIVWAGEPILLLTSGVVSHLLTSGIVTYHLTPEMVRFLGGTGAGRLGAGWWVAGGANTIWFGVWVVEFRTRLLRRGHPNAGA